jgi:hypothetical protein
MNQRINGNNDYVLKNSMNKLQNTHQMGGISQLTQSSKIIPKKDNMRESN